MAKTLWGKVYLKDVYAGYSTLRPDANGKRIHFEEFDQLLGKRLPPALETVEKSDVGSASLRKALQSKMEKRWNGSFALTGQLSSKRRSKGASVKN